MRQCKACSDFFAPNQRWQKFCDECYSDIKSKTVSAKESNHPALVAEREFEEDEYIAPDLDHVEACLREAKKVVLLDEEDDETSVKILISQYDCSHEFKKRHVCVNCGIHFEQFFFSVNAPCVWWSHEEMIAWKKARYG